MTEPATILVANFDEVSSTSDATVRLGLWQKAVLRSESASTLLVAPAIPSNLVPARPGMWVEPAELVVPNRVSSSVSSDVVSDQAALHRLAAYARSGPTTLQFQVWSRGMELLRDALVAEGARFTDTLPVVSSASVADWNSKVGGHLLFASLKSVSDHRPPTALVHSDGELRSLLSNIAPGCEVVAKANRSAGGRGIRVLSAASAKRWSGTFPAPGLKAPGPQAIWPMIVEQFVGHRTRNTSITVDLWIHQSGADLVGLARQLLGSRVRYRGVSSEISSVVRQSRSVIIALGQTIGGELSRRGYRGPLNVDFVVTPSGAIYVAEMNVRQSAPLDQFLVLARSDAASSPVPFVCVEDAKIPKGLSTAVDATRFLDASLEHASSGQVTCLAVYEDDSAITGCLLATADSIADAKRLLSRAVSVLADAP